MVVNNRACDALIDMVQVAVGATGLADHFRWPSNIINHQLNPTYRKIVLHLPLIQKLTSEQFDVVRLEIDAWIAAYGVELENIQMWGPTGTYPGSLVLRVVTPRDIEVVDS
jgi:hypothetical protein